MTPADARTLLLAAIRSGEFRLRREATTRLQEVRGVRIEMTIGNPPRLDYPAVAVFGRFMGLLAYLGNGNRPGAESYEQARAMAESLFGPHPVQEMAAGYDSTFRDSHEGRTEWWLLGFEMRAYADVGAT